MNRLCKALGSLGTLLLLACTAGIHDQAGVTSTGNAGELAGIVYADNSANLSRHALASATQLPADSALVVLLNSVGAVVDSQHTNRDGGFLFRQLSQGSYSVYAVFKQDTAKISAVQLSAELGYQALMVVGGSSGPAPVGSAAVSLYSVEAGQVEQSFLLNYQYDSTQQQIVVTRRIGTDNVQGTWQTNFSGVYMTLRDSTQANCTQGGEFFSTMPLRVQNNNWFYNGDLRTDYGIAADATCGAALPDLQEMKSFNMGGLELLFDTTQVHARFYQSNWCLNTSTTFPAVYTSFTPRGQIENVNCNTLRAISTNLDTVTIRTLWYDPSAAAASQELTHGKTTCIYTGLLADQNQDQCSVNGLLK